MIVNEADEKQTLAIAFNRHSRVLTPIEYASRLTCARVTPVTRPVMRVDAESTLAARCSWTVGASRTVGKEEQTMIKFFIDFAWGRVCADEAEKKFSRTNRHKSSDG